MSDQQPHTQHNPSTLGAATYTAGRVIDALRPPQFLVLGIVNVLMVGGGLWLMTGLIERRDAKILPIITACMRAVPVEVVEELLELKRKPPP